MINKDDTKLILINADGVELKANHIKSSDTDCVLFVPGFGGSFGDGFIRIAEICMEQGISFVFGYNQGCYTTHKLKKHNPDGSITTINGGGCYDNFDNIIVDMDCFLDYTRTQGYKNIYLIGASLGCDKIMKYLKEKEIQELKKIIFMCPQDISMRIDEDMLSEAVKNINNNEPDKILTRLFLDFCPISSKTFYDLRFREDIHNFPYLQDDKDLSNLNIINVPTLVIIGTQDQGLFPSTHSYEYLMNRIKENISDCTISFIEGAKHNFRYYEDELATKIIEFILKS